MKIQATAVAGNSIGVVILKGMAIGARGKIAGVRMGFNLTALGLTDSSESSSGPDRVLILK
jgi:hypothetical protein